MLHNNMKISRLMVHAHQVEETGAKRKNRDTNRARSFDGGSSKGRLDIQDKPRFKKRSSNQVPSKFFKAHDDRVSNLKSQKRRGTSSPNKKTTCGKCGKKHYGDCLVATDNCFGCGKSGHKVKNSLIRRVNTRVVVKLKQVVLMLMLQRRSTFIQFALGKRVLPMW